jgi:VCBS repeat-containing protein
MGCHSGLAVSDATVGGGASANDLAAALTARGAAYVASTGYGYGDQVSVGLQERLMTLFAGQLDGAVSLGDALRNAKQQYFGSQGLYGAYDEKALSSTILYGLPMFAVGTQRPVRPTPPNTTTTEVTPGLSSTHYDQNFTFTPRSGDIGNWFEASTGSGPQLPQITASRPVEPRAELDVTAAAPDNSLLPAHGAIVSGLLTGQVITDFDAAFSRPTLDNAAGEPEAVNSVAAFPTRQAGVTTISDTQGLVGPDGVAQRQKLVLIPGQFLSVAPGDPNGRGTQVLYNNMSGDVYYSPSTDWTAPKVGDVVLQRTPGDTFANVAVAAGDPSGIHRVVALYQAGGDWKSLDLGPSAGSFVGSLSVPAGIANDQIRVVVQAVDGAGNVSWASNKGPGFAPTPPPPPAPVVTLSPTTPASGWFSATPEITVTGAAGESFEVSLDGAPPLPYLGAFTPGGLANGSHVVNVTSSGGGSATVTVKIDTTPPQITASLSPASNAAGWRKSPVTATFTCSDSVSGVATCPPAKSTGVDEGAALVLSGTAVDKAGLTATVSETVKVDLTAPAAPTVTIDPATRPTGQTSTITATSTDSLSGVAGGEWWIGTDPGEGNANALTAAGASLTGVIPATLTGGSYVVSTRVVDTAGNWSGITTTDLTVTTEATPNSPPTADPQSVSTPEDTAVNVVLTGSDPDAGDTLTFTVETQPSHGQLSGVVPDLTYTPDANFNGPDSFTFTASDGSATSSPATVSITVSPVNDAPVAHAASVSTSEDTSVPVTLSGTDVDGDTLTVAIVASPTHGSLSGSGADRTYTPAANFNGSDSFSFTVSDGSATSSPATVSITVTPVNDAPVANAVTASAATAQPTTITLSGTDVDGDPLTFVIVTSPAHGTLTGTGPTVTYTSAAAFSGSDSFTYAVNDGHVQSTSATVSITVTAPSRLNLAWTDNASRTNASPLSGAVLRAGVSAYIFTTTDLTGLRQVSFSLDGVPFSTDRSTPFDFAGTSTARVCRLCVANAFPFESNLLSVGAHHITAVALLRDGSTVTTDSQFTVTDTTTHSLAVSTSPSRTSPSPLAGATLSGVRYVFLGDAGDPIAGLGRVVFQLDGRNIATDSSAPYDAFGTRRGVAAPFDTRRLRNGNHRIVAVVQLAGGGRIVYSATFRVAN